MHENQIDELLNNQLGLDDTFRFKCRGCGKCCKQREDVILTTRDIFNIAKKLSLTMEAAIEEYCEVYVGESSCMPIVRILPLGVNRACPLLKDKRCLVHDMKPVICAMYPIGRILVAEDMEKGLVPGAPIKTGYILNPVTCGSAKKQYTVRSWLERFGIPIEDEFYIQWNEMLLLVSPLLRQLEQAGAPERALQPIWGMVHHYLYVEYDTSKEFMPQFETNKNILMEHIKKLEKGLEEAGLIS